MSPNDTRIQIPEQALRAQYAASGLARLGISFEAAKKIESISISLECGARAAERAAQCHRNATHWLEPLH